VVGKSVGIEDDGAFDGTSVGGTVGVFVGAAKSMQQITTRSYPGKSGGDAQVQFRRVSGYI
jgi:hypothetical protein